MIRLVASLLATMVLLLAPAGATDFGTGRLPINVTLAGATTVTASTLLVVEGRVEADHPIVVVLRIDDDWSDSSYPSRVNEEKLTPPGSFRWVLPVHGLKTSGGRLLRTQALRRMHLFSASADGTASIGSFRFDEAPTLPPDTLAISLGHPDAPLFPGFVRLGPEDPRIVAGHAIPVRRPGVDPLIASGLRGVERLALPWPQGRARVTLWLEDVGEWESLPFFLRRRVRLNGIDVVDETFTPEQWIEARYLRGATTVYEPGADAWTTYGRRRGAQVTTEVEVGNDGLTVELAGDTPAATFISAVLVEPAGSTRALDVVTAQRRDWFNNAWPVDAAASAPRLPALPASFDLTLAAGTGRRLQFEVPEPAFLPAEIRLEMPEAPSGSFALKHWISQPRLDRVSTGTNLLAPSYRLLRGRGFIGHAASRLPQRHVLWVSAAADLSPGTYSGTLKIGGAHPIDVPVRIAVPRLDLPVAPKAAGFYLERPVHWGWFPDTAPRAELQLACDMRFLARLGIAGNAPPLPSPTNGPQAFVAGSRLALQNATTAPWLAYSAARESRERLGMDAAAHEIGRTLAALKSAGLPAPVWSIADEPSNPDQPGEPLNRYAALLRQSAPDVKLAGHLNSRNDQALLGLFDVALVNEGYGLDVQTLARVRRSGVTPWLYNTGKVRFSAGLWLWRTDAVRYQQWHARMPTADPFDPTDGREGDVQMFPPASEVCPAQPDIDEGVLEMAEGLTDQRWLGWLETAPGGADLLREIRAGLPTDWQSASRLAERDIEAIRDRIEALARGLK